MSIASTLIALALVTAGMLHLVGARDLARRVLFGVGKFVLLLALLPHLLVLLRELVASALNSLLANTSIEWSASEIATAVAVVLGHLILGFVLVRRAIARHRRPDPIRAELDRIRTSERRRLPPFGEEG